MGKLLSLLSALVLYLCVGTVIAQAIGVAYGVSQGYLTREKCLRMVAVAHGLDQPEEHAEETKNDETSEQPSFEDMEQARALRSRHLELREQALLTGLERLRYEQRKLLDEKESYDRVREAFDAHLKNEREGAVAKGRADVRAIWESVRPKLAKEQIVQMLDAGEEDEVVAILSEMPVPKQAKICAEFGKTEEELKKLDQLLRLIRKGKPEVSEIDATRDELQKFEPNNDKG